MHPPPPPLVDSDAAAVIALERIALDRWGQGDPGGYLELYAPEVTYFDPGQAARIDGLDAMTALYAPFAGQIRVDRYDMIAPKVQRHGEVAVLTFNLVSYQTRPEGGEAVVARWNATAVYRAVNGTWRSIHVHWSFIQPELKAPVSEAAS
jgi:ketosteroid isomerase-like protein